MNKVVDTPISIALATTNIVSTDYRSPSWSFFEPEINIIPNVVVNTDRAVHIIPAVLLVFLFLTFSKCF